MTILFICTGNTCRSPMAEGIYRARGGNADSAGVSADFGDPAAANAVLAAADYGADISRHRSKPVSAQHLRDCDRALCMTGSHLALLTARFPEYAAKYALLDPSGIPDPYGGDLETYRECAAAIAAAIDRI
jgi:protein-tyrosine-phosphatase